MKKIIRYCINMIASKNIILVFVSQVNLRIQFEFWIENIIVIATVIYLFIYFYFFRKARIKFSRTLHQQQEPTVLCSWLAVILGLEIAKCDYRVYPSPLKHLRNVSIVESVLGTDMNIWIYSLCVLMLIIKRTKRFLKI
jgi:hypothetical protein